LAFVVAVSLLTFPSLIPWLIAVWIGWYSVLALLDRPGWLPLIACVLIVVVKGIGWPPAMIVLVVAMAVAGLAAMPPLQRRIPVETKRLARIAACLLWVAWAIMALDRHAATHCSRTVELDANRPVAFLGDSIATGLTSRKDGCADQLARSLSVPVVNHSQPGLTASAAVDRLPALLETNPQVVVVELGGNDYLFGADGADVEANLETIIRSCQAADAEVVLMEIPRGFIIDRYSGLERRIARRHDLELISDTAIRKIILFGPTVPPGMWMDRSNRLSDDGLHPNARGAAVLAEHVAGTLERMYGEAVFGDVP